MSVRANFADIYFSTPFFITSIQFVACTLRENLSNRSSEVQIPRDICTRFRRYLYSTKCIIYLFFFFGGGGGEEEGSSEKEMTDITGPM